MRKLVVLLIGGIMISCQEDETLLTPTALFDINEEFNDGDYRYADLNVPLAFYNGSLNAVEFIWDFGDGTTSNVENPTHTFERTGDHIVKLTAISSDGVSSIEIKTIHISNRRIEKLFLRGMPLRKPDDSDYWDPAPDVWPDILFVYGEIGGDSVSIVQVGELKTNEIPAEIVIVRDAGGVFLSDTRWFLAVYDNDDPLSSFDGRDEQMFYTEFNPFEISSKTDFGESGTVVLSSGTDLLNQETEEFRVDINWFYVNY